MKSSLLAVVVQVATNARDWPPSFPPTDYFCKKDKESVQFSIKRTPKANFSTVKWDNCKTKCCTVEITQDKSYRLLLRSGRNYNRKIKATENIGVGRLFLQKPGKKVGSRAERRLGLPQDMMSVIYSMDSVLALGPWKTRAKSQWGCRTDTTTFSWFFNRLSQTIDDVVFCMVRGRFFC